MSVYIITDRDAGVCKIGQSKTPRKRFTMLKTSTYSLLRLEAVIPGCAACEKQLHSRFASSHVRREWFKINDEIEHLISCFPARQSGVGARKDPSVSKVAARRAGIDLPGVIALNKYLEEADMITAEFAQVSGLSRSQVNRLLTGRYMPTLPNAIAIERATRGKVKPSVWLETQQDARC